MTVATWADATATWADPIASWAYPGVVALDAVFEWSPTTDPGDAPVWVDITDYVLDGSISRGRQSEFDATSAARLRATLDNRDRTFDPTASSNAYPNKRIRVSLGASPDTVYIFDGWIDGMPQAYDPPNDATVSLTATDGFKMLARHQLDAIYGSEIEGDDPWLWWRFFDDVPQTTTCADASGNGRTGLYKGTPSIGQTMIVDGPGGSLVMDAVASSSSNESQSSDGVVALNVVQTSGPVSIECWIRTSHYGTNSSFICGQTHTVGSAFVVDYGFVVDNSTGRPSFVAQVGGVNGSVNSSVDIRDDGVHHLVGTIDTSKVMRFYLDGAIVGSNSTGASTSTLLGNSIRIGKPPVDFSGSGYTWGYRPFKGEACEFAVYSDQLDSSEITAHYTAGAAPWANESTGTRIGRVLGLVGWPVGDINLDTGVSTLGAARRVEGRSALDHLLDVERTEQGRFFIAGNGKATFYDRHHVVNTTAEATFIDTDNSSFVDLEFEFNDANIINDCTVTRVGGVPQRAQNATSIASFWRNSESITGVMYADDTEALAMAQWRVQNFGTPVLRPTRMTFDLATNLPDMFERVVRRELGDRVSMTRTLTGTDIEVDAVVEGITHRFTRREWLVTWNLSPLTYGVFGPGGGSGATYLTLNHAAVGQLDNNNRLAF